MTLTTDPAVTGWHDATTCGHRLVDGSPLTCVRARHDDRGHVYEATRGLPKVSSEPGGSDGMREG